MKSIFKKFLQWTGVLLVLCIVVSVAFLWFSGTWNVFFPSHDHDTVVPAIPGSVQTPAVLLFTKTNGFRHVNGIEAGSRFVKSLAEEQGWSVFHTENGAVFNAQDLSRFAVVMFHNVSGDTLSKAQQLAFQEWMQAGGGWVGTHASGDGSHKDWPWYVENLVGVNFTAHIMGPQFQVAEVHNESPDHPVMATLPSTWQHEEEWYSWKESPRGKEFTILATIDEDSYTPVQKIFGAENDLRMGDHPVVWSRCVGDGRSIYSALGHAAAAYDDKNHQRLLESAITWAMDTEGCREAP